MEIEIKNPSEAEQASLADEYEKALAFSADESAEYSLSHYRRMCRIVGCKLTPNASIRKKKTRLAAVLIAAAMLFALVGCTAAVYKEQIGNFFTEVYEDHIKGGFSTGGKKNSFIDEYYTLSYVPEGFELVEENVDKLCSRYVWENESGEKLIFEQAPLNSTDFFIDNESGVSHVIYCNGYTIYCRNINGSYRCIWNGDNYEFALYYWYEMSENEIIDIISKIEIVENH